MSASRSKPPTGPAKAKAPLPLHLVTEGAKRKRGGPKDVAVPSEAQYDSMIAGAHEKALKEDDLVQAVDRDERSTDMAHKILVEVCRSSASIKWDRERAVDRSQWERAAKLSSRRIRSLAEVGRMVVEADRAG
jgi:hypothetical protein